jgi:hypothetical protein
MIFSHFFKQPEIRPIGNIECPGIMFLLLQLFISPKRRAYVSYSAYSGFLVANFLIEGILNFQFQLKLSMHFLIAALIRAKSNQYFLHMLRWFLNRKINVKYPPCFFENTY